MRLSRNNRERLTDSLLTLVLLRYCASEDGSIGDRLKVTKLTFLAAHTLFTRQIKAFNFSFYRYHHGPFTTELYETWGELSWLGFLEIPPGPTGEISLTDAGLKAAGRYEQRLEQLGNQRLLEAFRHITDTYRGLSTSDLLRQVYEMKVVPLGWRQATRISDLPMSARLTCVLDQEEASESVTVDDATATEFFIELTRVPRPQGVSDLAFREIYASAVKGTRAERAGLPGRKVSIREMRENLEQGG